LASKRVSGVLLRVELPLASGILGDTVEMPVEREAGTCGGNRVP